VGDHILTRTSVRPGLSSRLLEFAEKPFGE